MRQCGECTACCEALAVAELNKPRYQRCAHLCEKGCGSYETRPGACRDYVCLWLQGFLDEQDRPDRLGVIFTTTSHPEQPELGTLPMLVECTPGALGSPRMAFVLEQLSERKPVVIITPAGRDVLDRVQVTVKGKPIAA